MKILLWTGASWEDWGPPSLETGLGGSETAAVHMAKNLAALGNEVVCVGQHKGFEGKFDGVEYINAKRFLEDSSIPRETDVFISSRDKNVISEQLAIVRSRAKVKILWMHDLHCGDDHKNTISAYDKVFVLSSFAAKTFRQYYPLVKADKIYKTRNGIDTSLYQPGAVAFIKGDFKFIYSSSPNRGLKELLEMWPSIKTHIPKAELHVYYGFNTWKLINKVGVSAEAIKLFERKVSDMESIGVFHHGRVGQKQLAEAMMRSSLWLYPTGFKETSCITAMEAQAAGTVAITTNLGALPETLQHGVLIAPHNTEPRYRTDFVGAVKKLATDVEGIPYRLRLAELGRRHAMTLSWEVVAKDWNARFVEWIR
jgi:glycosyltransferase involved in cell wall biosynthesis